MPTISFVCLANSYKLGGRCVAGIRIDGKGWIRPVGPSSSGELYYNHYRLNDGSEPQLLDVIEVDLDRPIPLPHQPENYLISGSRWRLLERPASRRYLNSLELHIVQGPGLFGNYSDRVEFEIFTDNPADCSLVLIQPEKLRWVIDEYEGKRKSRAFFQLGRRYYNLAITDPLWKRRISDLPFGTHALTEAGLEGDERIILTVSLGEPAEFDGNCYKLVAGIIIIPT